MSAESGPVPIERGIDQASLIIDKTYLTRDNRESEDAKVRRSLWEEARAKGELIAVYRCSDARIKPPGLEAISWGSISASEAPTRKLASNRGIKASLVLAHFDSEILATTGFPDGCGGLGVKRAIKGERHEKGVKKYVSEKIKSDDAVVSAVDSAIKIAKLSGKPVLAALQDHLTLNIFSVGYFDQEGRTIADIEVLSAVADKENYDRKDLYKEGELPLIAELALPDVFTELLMKNREEVAEIVSKYPHLVELQKVQKPRMVMLSTDIRSTRVRYPHYSSVPGSIFKVNVPREKTEGNPVIKAEDLENSLDELEYPLSESVHHHKDKEKPFSNTDRLIIETGSMALSRSLENSLRNRDWYQDWLKLDGRKTILIQTNQGIVNDADEVTA